MANIIDNKIIEERAVLEVQKLMPINRITQHINTESSEPSWDGYLNFYGSKDNKKDIIQIPVQVKGTTLKYEKNCFSISLVDLNNYLANGIIYFVVKFIKENDSYVKPRVLAKCLLGYEIKKILNNTKDSQKSLSIPFDVINNEIDIENICESYKHKQKTITTSNGNLLLFSQETLFSNITLLGCDNKFHKDIQIGEEYFVTFENNTQSFYIPDLLITEISKSLNFPVSVDEIIYFKKLIRYENIEGKIIFTFNDALSFELGKNESKILIKLNRQCLIEEYKLALEFLISIYKYNYFNIGTLRIPIIVEKEKKDHIISFYNNQFNILNLLLNFMKNMKQSKEYMLSSFSINEINQLIDIYRFDKEKISYHQFFSSNFSYILVRLQQGKEVYIYDIFDPEIYKVMNFGFGNKTNNYQSFKCSPILFLTANELSSIELPNIDNFNVAIHEQTTINEHTIKYLDIFLNRLMLAYDKCKKDILLDFSSIVLNVLENYNNQELIYKMYRCQITFRKDEPFSKEEHEYIDLMLEKEDIPACVFCAYTLNKDKYHASLFLEKIHNNWKGEAIYGIYQSLKNN